MVVVVHSHWTLVKKRNKAFASLAVEGSNENVCENVKLFHTQVVRVYVGLEMDSSTYLCRDTLTKRRGKKAG